MSCSIFNHRLETQEAQENAQANAQASAPAKAQPPVQSAEIEATHSDADPSTMQRDVQDLKRLVSDLSQRMQTLDEKMISMNEKINATQTGWNTFVGTQKLKTKSVLPHPSETRGVKVTSKTTDKDPEAGFTSDEALDMYKKANVLFDAQKYPEAVLGFSNFLRDYAEHPLAGSAQYFIGESYLRQSEYKMAIKEFEKVLLSYDRSSYIPETLRQIAEAEDKLQLSKEAGEHRHQLLTLFPQSPSAKTLAQYTTDDPSQALPPTIPIKRVYPAEQPPTKTTIQEKDDQELDSLGGAE